MGGVRKQREAEEPDGCVDEDITKSPFVSDDPLSSFLRELGSDPSVDLTYIHAYIDI